MAIYFQGNELEDFSAMVVSGGFAYVNDAGYNNTWVRSSMRMVWNGSVDSQTFSANDFWTHWRGNLGVTGAYSAANGIMTWFVGGTAYLSIWYNGSSGALEGKYWNGSSWTTCWTWSSYVNGVGKDWDIYIKVGTSGTGAFKCYCNGQVVGSAVNIDTTFGGAVSNFTKFRLAAGNASTNSWLYASEVLIADFVTIGSKLVTIIPNAAGTYAEFTGAYTTIDEQALGGDLSSSSTANQRLSAGFSDMSALGSGEAIVNVKAVAAMSRDTTGPTNMNFFTRISATDYNSADQAVTLLITDEPKPVQNWTVSPATSSPWTVTEINGAEFGIRSRT